MSIRVDDLHTLADEQRDGTGPEHFRPAFDLDDLRDRDENERLELAVERAATLRAVSAPRRDELVAAAHREMQRPRFTGAELGFLVCGALLVIAWVAFLAVLALWATA